MQAPPSRSRSQRCRAAGKRKALGALLLSALVAAGCAGPPTSGSSTTAGQPPSEAAARPSVTWVTAFKGDTLSVELLDPRSFYRVEQVALVGPDGAVYPAADLTRDVIHDYAGPYGGGLYRPGVGVGGGFGSGGGGFLGIGLNFPIGAILSEPATPAPPTTRTIARIPVPQSAAIRESAEDWQIEIVLTDPSGERNVARIPAPPAASP